MSIDSIRMNGSGIPAHLRPAQERPAIAPAAVRPAPQAAPGAGDVLSGEEKAFFADLFPSSADDLRSHETYRRDGSTQTVRTGTVIDRKG